MENERALAFDIAVLLNAQLETKNRKLAEVLRQAQMKIAGDNRALASDVLLENIARALHKSAIV